MVLQRVESELRVVNENIARCGERTRAISVERAALVSRATAQERLAAQANTRMEMGPIEQAISTLEAKLRDTAGNLEEVDAEVRRLSQERNEVEMAISQYEAALAQESQKLAAGQAAISRLQRRGADLGFKDAINWSAEELAKSRADAENEQKAIQPQKAKDENELTSVTQDWKSVREARERVGRDLDQCASKLARVTEAIRRTERLCQQLGVGTHDPGR
jgi:chromosome segregation ATPase